MAYGLLCIMAASLPTVPKALEQYKFLTIPSQLMDFKLHQVNNKKTQELFPCLCLDTDLAETLMYFYCSPDLTAVYNNCKN